MFTSVEEPSPLCDVVGSCDQLAPMPRRQDFSSNNGVSALDVRWLAPRTEVVVKTRNSRYHLVMCQGGTRAFVQGGHDFPQETEARIDGSGFGGSCLKLGWIAVGFSLEIVVGTQRVITSPVCSIDIMSRPAELAR